MRTKSSDLWLKRLGSALAGSTAREVTKDFLEKGGPGSGHHGHAGRPGQVGGSVSGGVAVGRADSPEADEHFKFSGTAELSRASGRNVKLAMSDASGGKGFEVHGAVDKKGNIKKGKCSLRVGGETVEIDHDELHAIRSKMRYMNMINERGVTEIAGKPITRGNALEVTADGKKVSIPVNADTVKEFDEAAKMARSEGLSFTGESKREVGEAVRAMGTRSPISVVKDRGFSKAGQLAAFMGHSNLLSERAMRGIVDGKKEPKAQRYLSKVVDKIQMHRASGHDARKEMSGTQAMKEYKRAAVWMTAFMRRK
jgi:hypothetical protein